MILLSVGYSKDSNVLSDGLSKLSKYYKDKNINIGMCENDIGSMHYIKCILKDTESDIKAFEEHRDMFYMYVSNIIYDFISKEYEMDLLKKLISEEYGFMDAEDIEEIKKRCSSVVYGTGIFSPEGAVYTMACKNSILKKIDEFLEESSEIIIDGFMTFRLKEINEILKEMLDKIIEEYTVEKEYSEFIKLLKYFVDIQESRYDIINIIINKDGDYIIKDKDRKDITKEFFEDFDMNSVSDDVNKHDVLVSAVITSAPKKISVHGMENCKSQETFETLKSIFLENMTFCSGCDMCKDIIYSAKQK